MKYKQMKRKTKLNNIIQYFHTQQPKPKTELNYNSEYELTVAVILSAQCTDKRVNLITPNFFIKFPDFFSLSKAIHQEVFACIKSCSYPNNKTKHLIQLAKELTEKHKGKIPYNSEELMKLPGIGRKTAHVLLSVLKGEPVLAVDTHVFRVANRIGLAKNAKTSLAVEKQIVELVEDKAILSKLHHWLMLHGRYVCLARKPKCKECGISKWCGFGSE